MCNPSSACELEKVAKIIGGIIYRLASESLKKMQPCHSPRFTREASHTQKNESTVFGCQM